jgi:CrcB protein
MDRPDRDQDGATMDDDATADDDTLPIDPDLAPDDPGQPDEHPGHPARYRPRGRHGRAEPGVLAVISLGGMLGSSARYGIARLIPTAEGGFPWATFWTNLSGSFLLGLFLIVILERLPHSRYLRPFVATGIIGAYTTMSTYLVETALLVKDGHASTGLLYGIGSLVAGLVLAYAGIRAGRLIPRRDTAVAP